MNHRIHKFILAVFCTGAAGASLAGGVTINYVHPETFSDLPIRPAGRESALGEFTDRFRKLGATLPAGQTLAIDVLDIDLAGHVHPNPMGREDVRIMRDNRDWPLMHVRYTLSEHGKVIGSGDMKVTDTTPPDDLRLNHVGTNFPHEMRMIDNWWRQTIQPIEVAQR